MTPVEPGSNFEKWEKRYVENFMPWDSGKTDDHLRAFLKGDIVSPCKTLEVGCGTGTNAIWLQEQGFDVLGVDLSPTAIAKATVKANNAQSACRLRVADIRTDEMGEAPFALVYDRACFHVFEHASERTDFAKRVAELLETGGLWHSLIGSTDGPPRETGPPRRSAAQITAEIEPYFEILQLNSTQFDQIHHAEARAWVMVARKRTL